MTLILKQIKSLLLGAVILLISSNVFANSMAIDESKFLVYHGAALYKSSIIVVDVSDPSNPVQVNSIAVSAAPRSLYLDTVRNLLFVSKYQYGIEVIDVSDPNSPILVGSWDGPSYGLSIQDDVAYVATNKEYFDVLDISNLSKIKLLDQVDYFSFGGPTALPDTSVTYIHNGHLWVGASTNNVNVFEILAPGVLNRVEGGINYGTSYKTRSIAFGNNVALILNGSLESRDTTAFSFLDRLTMTGGLGSIIGNYAYLGTGKHIRIIDISDPTNLAEIAPFRHAIEGEGIVSAPSGAVLQGNILFLVQPNVGDYFKAIDVSNPLAPVVLSRFTNVYLDGEPAPEPNIGPRSDAGEDLYVGTKKKTWLDGTGSFDTDGDIVKYEWTQISGYSVSLNDAQTSTPNFRTPNVKRGYTWTLTFQLIVIDDQGARSTDTVKVFVSR